MRKIRPTPLFIISIGLILVGLYLLISGDKGEEGWGYLSALVFIGLGGAGLFVYVSLRSIFKAKIWRQSFAEIALILILLYIGYKRKGSYLFQLPHNYRGYVILVYGIEKAPKLKKTFYSNKTKIAVPASGIMLTSSLPDDNFNELPIFSDSTLGKIERLPPSLKRYSIPYSTEKMVCGNKNYMISMWLIKDEPNWSVKDDTINRLDVKLIQACDLIGE